MRKENKMRQIFIVVRKTRARENRTKEEENQFILPAVEGKQNNSQFYMKNLHVYVNEKVCEFSLTVPRNCENRKLCHASEKSSSHRRLNEDDAMNSLNDDCAKNVFTSLLLFLLFCGFLMFFFVFSLRHSQTY